VVTSLPGGEPQSPSVGPAELQSEHDVAPQQRLPDPRTASRGADLSCVALRDRGVTFLPDEACQPALTPSQSYNLGWEVAVWTRQSDRAARSSR
jgi:hypothetical protein